MLDLVLCLKAILLFTNLVNVVKTGFLTNCKFTILFELDTVLKVARPLQTYVFMRSINMVGDSNFWMTRLGQHGELKVLISVRANYPNMILHCML